MNTKCLVCLLSPYVQCKCGFRMCEEHAKELWVEDSKLRPKLKNRVFDVHAELYPTCEYIQEYLSKGNGDWSQYRIK